VVGNWLFFKDFFKFGQTTMRGYFGLLPWILLFIIPAVTMRLWSEEKRSGTIEFLLTLPVTNWQVVLAKFLGALAFIFLTILLSLTIPFSLSFIGDLDWGPVIGGYLGALFLASAYISIGLLISSLTKNQIIAFIISLAACFIVFIIGEDFILVDLNNFLAPVFRFLGLGAHFKNIAKGIIDIKDLIYYISVSFIFVYINAKVIEARNWK
jgi:ABC-2 type transport system permease protein